MDKSVIQLVMSIRYIQDVLGVQQFIKPSHWDRIYTLHSSLDKDTLILTGEEYTAPYQQLSARIMKSLNRKNYTVVCWKDFNYIEGLRNLLLRSTAQSLIAFGELWVESLRSFCSQPVLNQKIVLDLTSKVQVPAVITYSFAQLSDESDSDLKKKKLSTFSALKSLSGI